MRRGRITRVTDGISWLAEPQSIAFGGYHVTLARGLAPEALAARIAASAQWSEQAVRPVGELTGDELLEELESEFGDAWEGVGLRLGTSGGWAFAVAHGGWFGEFRNDPAISGGGAEVFRLEYEEENGKPVPPAFHHHRDGRTVCSFNLHLDASWGTGEVEGDPDVVREVEERLSAEGLPDDERPHPEVHRAALRALERQFGLTLPRALVLESPLPAVLLVRAGS